MPSRYCIQYVSKSGRCSSGYRTGKGQSSSQFPRRVVLKNMLTIGQLHLSPMLVRSRLKSCMLHFSIMWTKNFQMSKLGLEKEGRNQRSNCKHSLDQRERRQWNSRKTSTSVSSTTPKPLTVWIIINWKALKEMGMPDRLTCLLRNLYSGQETTVGTLYGTTNWFRVEEGV